MLLELELGEKVREDHRLLLEKMHKRPIMDQMPRVLQLEKRLDKQIKELVP